MSTEAIPSRPTPPPAYLGMPKFSRSAAHQVANEQLRKNLRQATGITRARRAARVAEVPEWEDLCLAAAGIKDRALRHLDTYLLQLEEALTKSGATVHWAGDAAEANSIIVGLVEAKHVDEVLNAQSITTQEIELNEALQEAEITAWETDLSELIVQLGNDRPSHVSQAAIHRDRGEVREIFLREMGQYGTPAPARLTDEPAELVGAAREHLREKFLHANVAISGVSFAIAETGTLVVVESEGNGRMCLTLPETLILVVGIEEVLPTLADLEVFLRLLPPSSTGERMDPYVSMWTGVTYGDGPAEMHVVLLDNGRTGVLADPKGRSALRCIRCSACLNACPVYERVGGHAYGSVYSGPIGAVLNPQLRGVGHQLDQSLPYASTLCGACFEVCPVRIPIPEMLVHLRKQVVDHQRGRPLMERLAMRAAARALGKGKRLRFAQRVARLVVRMFPNRLGSASWKRARDLPAPPPEPFRDWWRANRGGDAK